MNGVRAELDEREERKCKGRRGKDLSMWLMRASRGSREEAASRGINGSVYATGFHLEERFSLGEKKRNYTGLRR